MSTTKSVNGMSQPERTIKTDCVHYRGDRPCSHHKADISIVCENCTFYRKASSKALIVKLDASGDVLRTTCILDGARKKYPDAIISWITLPGNIPLLENISGIKELIPWNHDAVALLETEPFDIVLGLDASKRSARITTLAHSEQKFGFGLNNRGEVVPLNEGALPWYQMGLWDDLKRSNTRSYPEIIHQVADLPFERSRPYVNLRPEEIENARHVLESSGFEFEKSTLGLVTGAGKRWRFKSWTLENQVTFIESMCNDHPEIQIVLFGGPEEEDRHKDLMTRFAGELVDTGNHNDLRTYMALLDFASVIVTPDSLAFHIALGLNKQVICLVGPTSSAELDVDPSVTLLTSREVDCLGCYKPWCDFKVNCMNTLSPSDVLSAAANHFEFPGNR